MNRHFRAKHEILKLSYYRNYCMDFNQILHTSNNDQICFMDGPETRQTNHEGRDALGGGVHRKWFEWRFWVYFCIWLVCEKLTIFPYVQYIIGNVSSLAFWRCS